MIKFSSISQFVCCILFGLFGTASLVGGFYNPIHFLLGTIELLLCRTIYKHW